MSINEIHWSEIVGVKILGTPVSALGGVCDDGDGDGMCTPPGGDEDNVPVPQRLFPVSPLNHKPAWSNVEDIVDWEALGHSEPPDEEEMYDQFRGFVEHWGFWDPCRDMRKAGYGLAGLEPGNPDPNVHLRDRDRFAMGISETEAHEAARYFMGRLVEDIRAGHGEHDPLYRAMRVDGDKEDDVLAAFQPGEQVDIPLLAFADRRRQGPNEYLADRFGDDFLLEVQPGAAAVDGGHFDPHYDEHDEKYALQRIDDILQEIDDEIQHLTGSNPSDVSTDTQDEIDRLEETRDELAAAVEHYRDLPTDTGLAEIETARERINSAMQDAGYDEETWRPRWSGEIIPEEDSEWFYDALDNPGGANVPQEKISGGRFEVIDVTDDPLGRYQKIIKLRQVGAFDPQQRGAVVFTPKAGTKAVPSTGPATPATPVDFPAFNEPLTHPSPQKPGGHPSKPTRKKRGTMFRRSPHPRATRKTGRHPAPSADWNEKALGATLRPHTPNAPILPGGGLNPPGRVPRFAHPRDGDGDGMFSPKPGMPDRTPLPPMPAIPQVDIRGGVLDDHVDFDPMDAKMLPHGTEHIARTVRVRKGDRIKGVVAPVIDDLGRLHGADPNGDLVQVLVRSKANMILREGANGKFEAGKARLDGDWHWVGRIQIDPSMDRPGQVFTFLHEFGHRMDVGVFGVAGTPQSGAANAHYYSHTDTPAMNRLMEAIRNLPEHDARKAAVKAMARQGLTEEYFWSRQEIWARAYSQWAAAKLHRQDAAKYQDVIDHIAKESQKHPYFNFTDSEMKVLGPMIESVLRERGLL